MDEGVNINDLPTELVIVICGYLKGIEVAILETTCKKYRAIIKEEPVLQERIEKDKTVYDKPRLNPQRVEKNARFLWCWPSTRVRPNLLRANQDNELFCIDWNWNYLIHGYPKISAEEICEVRKAIVLTLEGIVRFNERGYMVKPNGNYTHRFVYFYGGCCGKDFDLYCPGYMLAYKLLENLLFSSDKAIRQAASLVIQQKKLYPMSKSSRLQTRYKDPKVIVSDHGRPWQSLFSV